MRHRLWSACCWGVISVVGLVSLATLAWAAIPTGAPVQYSALDTVTMPAGTTFNAQTLGALGPFTASSSLTAAANVALSGVISPTQITASQNNYNPTGLSTASVLRLSTSASWNLTGLAGGAAGRLILIHNIGTSNLTLLNESASSTAANRFEFPGDLTLIPKAMVLLQYDATSLRWHTSYPSLTAGPVSASLLNFTVQGSDPTAPSAGILTMYTKSGGVFTRDSSGNVVGPLGTGGGGGSATFATVRVATTANLDLTGTETVDGISVGAGGELVLAKDQSTGSQNGIYVASTSGWTRSTSFDTSAEFVAGFPVYVQDGTANAGTVWNFSVMGSFTLGTTAATFTKTGAGPTGELITNKNANSGYLGLTSTGDSPWDRVESYATHTDLVATSQIDQATHQKRSLGIQNSGAGNVTLTTGNPRITGCDSGHDGDRLLLVGLSATKTVTIPTGNGLLLAGDAGSVVVGVPPGGMPAEFRCRGSTTTWEQVGALGLQQAYNTGNDIFGATSAATAVRIGADANNHTRIYTSGGSTLMEGIVSGALSTFTTINNLVFGISGSKPTCSVTERFKVWVTAGGAGVADLKEICDKDSTDTYAWRSLGGGGSRTTTIPMQLMSLNVTDANAFQDSVDGTNFDYSGVRYVDAVTGCAFYKTKIPTNLASTPAWNLIATTKVISGSGGVMVATVTGKDYATNVALDSALTSLVSAGSFTLSTSANTTLTNMSATNFDATEAIAANNLLIVKFCRDGGSGSDVLSSDVLLIDLSLRIDVN